MGWLEEVQVKRYLQKANQCGWADYVVITNAEFDRFTAIARGAEWGSLNAASYEPICPLCRNIEREGHKTTCEYHEDWTP